MFKILIKKSDLNLIDSVIVEDLKSYFYNFNNALCQKLSQEKHIRIKEQEFIDIYKQNNFRMQKLREMINYEITDIKQRRPDIIASWKYCQEFEKMCKELE